MSLTVANDSQYEARRRQALAVGLNGIDYIETAPIVAGSAERTLQVHFLAPLTESLVKEQMAVDNERRGAAAGVLSVMAKRGAAAATVVLAGVVDSARYRLRLRADALSVEPPPGFDSILSASSFSFEIDQSRSLEGAPPIEVAPRAEGPAPLDYLARDFQTLRRFMLDRLASSMPDWRDREEADLAVAVVELLAYVADYQSYRLDAAAAEAYLETARLRSSVRRHARLLDYRLHDGCNARAWVCFEAQPGSEIDGWLLPEGTQLLTRSALAPVTLRPEQAAEALQRGAKMFETMHPLRVRAARNRPSLYTWGELEIELPKGATRAYVVGAADAMQLGDGDVVVIEEVRGPQSGLAADADPTRRHPVRLVGEPVSTRDELFGVDLVEIRWQDEDALPWPLPVRQLGEGEWSAVVRGNVALADYGRTIHGAALDPPEVPVGRRYRPRLPLAGLAFSEPYRHEDALAQSAAWALVQDPRRAVPRIEIRNRDETWRAVSDLLNSSRFAPELTVEVEADGVAYLRFGDNVLGKKPIAGDLFQADYRVGVGAAGNVGAGAIRHAALSLEGLTLVDNPLAAVGGVEPESLEQARLYAPHAFRKQRRAVTEPDYATMCERHSEVNKAVARLRWTGSWRTAAIAVDRAGGRPVDAEFRAELRSFLEPYRLIGHDLILTPPQFIPLEIGLRIVVREGYQRQAVKTALLSELSASVLADGRLGFFHPDNFTFGQTVYLSPVIAAAAAVTGVARVDPLVFRRAGRGEVHALAEGKIELDLLEIARLDNDPEAPDNGRLELAMEGGI